MQSTRSTKRIKLWSRVALSLQRTALGIVDVFFPTPPVCALCRGPGEIAWNSRLCEHCLDRLPAIGRRHCAACGRATRQRLCSQCEKRPSALDHARAYGVYDGYLQSVIRDLKFRGEIEAAQGLGELMAWVVAADGRYGRIDAVVPVPLHSSRLRERGYNQAELLARVVARHLCKRVIHPVVRVRETASQSTLTWEDRPANVRRAFAVPTPASVKGRSLLLVDDVYTTGGTLSAVATALKRAGCARCTSVCAAAASLDAEFASYSSEGVSRLAAGQHLTGDQAESRRK